MIMFGGIVGEFECLMVYHRTPTIPWSLEDALFNKEDRSSVPVLRVTLQNDSGEITSSYIRTINTLSKKFGIL